MGDESGESMEPTSKCHSYNWVTQNCRSNTATKWPKLIQKTHKMLNVNDTGVQKSAARVPQLGRTYLRTH